MGGSSILHMYKGKRRYLPRYLKTRYVNAVPVPCPPRLFDGKKEERNVSAWVLVCKTGASVLWAGLPFFGHKGIMLDYLKVSPS